jgi:hypothetical protein
MMPSTAALVSSKILQLRKRNSSGSASSWTVRPPHSATTPSGFERRLSHQSRLDYSYQLTFDS